MDMEAHFCHMAIKNKILAVITMRIMSVCSSEPVNGHAGWPGQGWGIDDHDHDDDDDDDNSQQPVHLS